MMWPFRLAIRLLPRSLRDQHGKEMLLLVRRRLGATRGSAKVEVYLRELYDLCRTVLKESLSYRSTPVARSGSGLFGPDTRYALRGLRRRPGYAVIITIILAIGMAAPSAVFTVVNGMLLRPLPYHDSGRLVMVWTELNRSSNPEEMTSSPMDFLDWRHSAASFEALAAYNLWYPVLSKQGSDSRTLMAGEVTTNMFGVLGVRPAIGRVFTEEESRSGAPVVVMSHELWSNGFGSDSSVVGSAIILNGTAHRVLGVLPEGYRHPDPHRPLLRTELFKPFDTSDWSSDPFRYLRVVARLAPGATVESAEAELDAIALRLEQARPDRNRDTGTIVYSLRDQFLASHRTALKLVLLGAGLVFLIVLANLANLVLTRALGRRREFAVRASLGAGRRRIARQLLLENGILALSGATVGLVAVVLTLDALRSLQGRYLTIVGDIQLDWRVLTFAIALAALSTAVLGLLPLVELFRTPLNSVLSEEGRGSDGSRRSKRIRSGLIVAEVALAAGLVVGAGLLGRSFQKLAAVGPGFDPDPILTVELTAPRERYQTATDYLTLYREIADRFESLPGLVRVAYASQLPMVDGNWSRDYQLADQPIERGSWPTSEFRLVSQGYFSTMGIPLVAGREFAPSDDQRSLSVIVVNQEFAERHWPDGQVLGRRIRWEGGDSLVTSEIVGVVGNVLDDGLTADPEPFIYYPFDQFPRRSAAFAIRTAGDPTSSAAALREAIRQVDPLVPVDLVEGYRSRIRETIAGPQLASLLATVFSAVALAIAGLGIYGVMSYAVVARTREIGIRSALGATGRSLVGLFLGRSLALTGLGLVVGLSLAGAGARVVESLLFGVSSADPMSFVAAVVVLLAVTIGASYLPARRALAVQPIEALKSDGH